MQWTIYYRDRWAARVRAKNATAAIVQWLASLPNAAIVNRKQIQIAKVVKAPIVDRRGVIYHEPKE